MGIMEKKMETTIVGYIVVILGFYRGNMGIMEKKMEATILYNRVLIDRHPFLTSHLGCFPAARESRSRVRSALRSVGQLASCENMVPANALQMENGAGAASQRNYSYWYF